MAKGTHSHMPQTTGAVHQTITAKGSAHVHAGAARSGSIHGSQRSTATGPSVHAGVTVTPAPLLMNLGAMPLCSDIPALVAAGNVVEVNTHTVAIPPPCIPNMLDGKYYYGLVM